jgi:sugar lactone lactonase YvrE
VVKRLLGGVQLFYISRLVSTLTCTAIILLFLLSPFLVSYSSLDFKFEALAFPPVNNTNAIKSNQYEFSMKWDSDAPQSLTVDSLDNIYVAGTNQIQKFISNGTFLMKWIYTSSSPSIAVDPLGNVYLPYFNSSNVVKLTSNGEPIKNLSTYPSHPKTVATDFSGNVYVATGDNSIGKTSDNSPFGVWTTSNESNFKFTNGVGLCVDSANNVYVADSGNNRVKKFKESGNESGILIDTWGKAGREDGQFITPLAIAVDSSDNVYVADTGNNRIQKFDSNGTFISKIGSAGSSDGQLSLPSGIAVDSLGNIYVADRGNNRIQVFTQR